MLAFYTRFKFWLANLITAGVSTMECAFIFAALAILGFPAPGAPLSAYVQWFSQTFIQLTMLSILAVQQKQTQDLHAEHKADMARLGDHLSALHEKFDTHIAHKQTQRSILRDPKTGRFIKKEAIA